MPGRRITALAAACALAGCGGAAAPAPVPGDDTSFAPPTAVVLRGYDGDAMEPFLSPDGDTLFYNTSNAPGADTDLRWAARAAAHAFDDRGPLAGANSPSLDAVPSLDREGRFVFISTRAYDRTLATIHAGRFAGGRVDGVALVPGLAAASRGWLAFDAGLSADGAILLFAEGRFDGGHVPREADLVLAARAGDRFARVADGARVLARVNTPGALEYAPALSADGLELFFTRADLEAVPPRVAILVARRPTPDGVFAAPLRIAAIDGFAEAPALSADGSTLLFHRRDADGRYRIYEARRPRPAAGGQASADRVIHSPSRSPSVSSSPIAGAQPTAAPTLSRRPRSSG